MSTLPGRLHLLQFRTDKSARCQSGNEFLQKFPRKTNLRIEVGFQSVFQNSSVTFVHKLKERTSDQVVLEMSEERSHRMRHVQHPSGYRQHKQESVQCLIII